MGKVNPKELLMVNLTRKDVLWNKSKAWKVKDTIDKHRSHSEIKLTVPTLMQTEWWIDKNRRPHRVEDISLHYVRNLINFLERRAGIMYAQYSRAYINSMIKVFGRLVEGTGYVDWTGKEVTLAEFWGSEEVYELAIEEADKFFGNLHQYNNAADWMSDTPLLKALYARL